ncbi:MAG: hypothetical protein AAF693_07690 [Bacteroidota bacterium]
MIPFKAMSLWVMTSLPMVAFGQIVVHPYSIHITQGEFVSFDGTNTRIKVYIDTRNNNFIEVLPKTALDLIDTKTQIGLSALAEERKRKFREKAATLASQGTLSYNPNMIEDSANLHIEGQSAKDTTGFVMDLYSVAVPPRECTSLRLQGVLYYSVLSNHEYTIDVKLPSVSNMVENATVLQTENGDALTIRKYDGDGESDTDYYEVALSGHQVKASGLKGTELSGFNYTPLTFEEAKKPQTFTLLITPIEDKILEIDEVISLGIGYRKN